MEPIDEKKKRKLVWDRATAARWCPPDEILIQEGDDPARDAHLETCARCRERVAEYGLLSHGKPKSAERFSAFQERVRAMGDRSEPPEPFESGQIRALSGDLAGWEADARYVNPPDVLLLDDEGEPDGPWLVAQVYDDFSFFWNGDVALDSEPESFAEPWNVYSIPAEEIGRLVGRVGSETARVVLDASENADLMPQPPVTSMLARFRQLEAEVARAMLERSAGADVIPLFSREETDAFSPFDLAVGMADASDRTAAGEIPLAWEAGPDGSRLFVLIDETERLAPGRWYALIEPGADKNTGPVFAFGCRRFAGGRWTGDVVQVGRITSYGGGGLVAGSDPLDDVDCPLFAIESKSKSIIVAQPGPAPRLGLLRTLRDATANLFGGETEDRAVFIASSGEVASLDGGDVPAGSYVAPQGGPEAKCFATDLEDLALRRPALADEIRRFVETLS